MTVVYSLSLHGVNGYVRTDFTDWISTSIYMCDIMIMEDYIFKFGIGFVLVFLSCRKYVMIMMGDHFLYQYLRGIY